MESYYLRTSRSFKTLRPKLPVTVIVAAWLTVCSAAAIASDTADVDLNLMVAPSSPAFVLLGSEPAVIPRPTQAVDLAITILNETDGLSTLPDDFSVEFAPYWIFGGRQDFSEWSANKFSLANMGRSTRFSLGTRSRTDTIFGATPDEFTTMQTSALGVGLTFTILPGKLDTSTKEYGGWHTKTLANMKTVHDTLSGALTEVENNDQLYIEIGTQIKALGQQIRVIAQTLDDPNAASRDILETRKSLFEDQRTVLEEKKSLRRKQLGAAIEEEYAADLESLREQVAEQPMRRVGVTAEVAGGMVFDFPGREVQNHKLTRWGAWATVGWSWPKLTGLLLGRALGNDQTSDNVSYDFGGRVILDNYKKVSFSVEGLHRWFPNREGDLDKSTWRVAFQSDYAIAKNKSISVTLGRDFSGERSGNLISLVNLVMGFGSNRSIEN